jgi:phospholipase/carboxylesterase
VLLQRRQFLKVSAAAGIGLVACSNGTEPELTIESATITARPRAFSGTAPRGFHSFGVWHKDDAYLYVPPTYRDDTPAPFLVLLHGSHGHATDFKASLPSHVDDKGIVVLAVDSTLATWDLIGILGFGPDPERLNLALDYAFSKVNVDPTHVAIGGFSDGASYALSVGPVNGDLFTAIIAFSAGKPTVPGARGKPPIFMSHGTSDLVIPITLARDTVRPEFVNAGYSVTFREFAGGHQIPAAVAEEAYNWFLAQ